MLSLHFLPFKFYFPLKLGDFETGTLHLKRLISSHSVPTLLNLPVPNSASVAALIGVMGGWSPASWPFLGRLMPSDSSAFTWVKKEITYTQIKSVTIEHKQNKPEPFKVSEGP